MSNKTQAQLLKSATNAINGNTNTATKVELMNKAFPFLTTEDFEKLVAPTASPVELAAKLYLAKKQEFLNANVTIGQLAIAMNYFRKSIETQYGLDFNGLRTEIIEEIVKINPTKEEIQQSIAEAHDEMKDKVPTAMMNFLAAKTTEIIDQYYIDHPETGMKKENKEVITNEVLTADLPKDAAGNTADVVLDNTPTATVILEHNGKEIEVIDTPAPDLSTPRARFLHRMGKTMEQVERKDQERGTGNHCHDFKPEVKVDECVKYIEEVKADQELNDTCKSTLVTFGNKMLAHHTKCLVKDDEARENYDPNSFKFKLLNFFGATAY